MAGTLAGAPGCRAGGDGACGPGGKEDAEDDADDECQNDGRDDADGPYNAVAPAAGAHARELSRGGGPTVSAAFAQDSGSFKHGAGLAGVHLRVTVSRAGAESPPGERRDGGRLDAEMSGAQVVS